MSTFKPCNYKDCPVHPEYKEEIQEEVQEEIAPIEMKIEWDQASHSHTGFPGKMSVSIPSPDFTTTTNNTFDAWGSIDSIDTTLPENPLKIIIHGVNIAIECLMCTHFELKDMRAEIIANRAKEKLEGKS